ncbi:MAG: ROK family protein [Actinomycetota bacterium]
MTSGGPGLRSASVRRTNLSTILRLLHLDGPMSRTSIRHHTGLTRGAVGTLVADLEAMGFVRETTPAPDGTPGRPSPIVRPRARTNATIGIDLMVDSTGVVLQGLGGAVLRSIRRDRAPGRLGADDLVADAVRLVDQVRSTADADTRIFGVGIAVPGLVDRDGRLTLAPNLGLAEIDLGRRFEAVIHDLPVIVHNEANLGALAESRRGAAAGRDHVLYLSGEVGVGGGIIADGEPLTGRAGFAGEVGHVPVNPDGLLCGCGAVGCWETEVGEPALLTRAGLPPDGGRPAVETLLNRAGSGDDATRHALAAHARWLGVGLAGLLNVLDVEAVVLGGLFGRLHPHLAEDLDAELDRRVLPALRDRAVVASTLGDDAPVIGAAEAVWRAALDDPVTALDRLRSPAAAAG